MTCLRLERARLESRLPQPGGSWNYSNNTQKLFSVLNYRVQRVEGRKSYVDAYEEPVRTAVERGGR
jgi:hypothetical protein